MAGMPHDPEGIVHKYRRYAHLHSAGVSSVVMAWGFFLRFPAMASSGFC